MDPFAQHVFASVTTVNTCGLTIEEDLSEVKLGDNSIFSILGRTTGTIMVGQMEGYENIFIVPEGSHESSEEELPTVIVGTVWLRKHNPNIDWDTGCLRFRRPGDSEWVITPKGCRKPRSVQCKPISFKKIAKLEKEKNRELSAVQLRSYAKKVKVAKQFTDIVEDFGDIFKEELTNEPPPKRHVEFQINLMTNEPPPGRPVIRLSMEELKELKKKLQCLLERKLLRPSTSPFGAPVFFVKKNSGDLRTVCDYTGLNNVTITDSTQCR